jgi:peptide-methionine (R)-S-oxide reductase
MEMVRMAISCRRSDAHLGHVFDDGPQPNWTEILHDSVAFRFVKIA